MKNRSFTFRSLWFEAICDQPDHVRLSLMDAICRYAINGELPSGLDPVAQVAFTLIRAEIDSSARKKRNDTPPAGTPQETAGTGADAQPSPVTDTFDADFEAAAERLKNDRESCRWLGAKGCLYNTKVALREFRQYIIDQGRTAEFTGDAISSEALCDMMLDAIPSDIYSKAAYSNSR